MRSFPTTLRGAGAGADAARPGSAPGERPAAGAVAATRTRVRITAVDTANNVVSFIGPSRVERTVAVRAPELQEFLQTLKPGDQVDVAIAEAAAIRVEPAER